MKLKVANMNMAETRGTSKMKITKRQLRRIIKEEKTKILREYDRDLTIPHHGREVPVEPPEVEELGVIIEEHFDKILDALIALSEIDENQSGSYARYLIDQLHGYKK